MVRKFGLFWHLRKKSLVFFQIFFLATLIFSKKQISNFRLIEMKVVYYDLMTTHRRPCTLDGPHGVQIVQIGAVTGRLGNEQLNLYVIPTCDISDHATRFHGLTHEILLEDEIEYENVMSLRAGLQLFMDFLEHQKEHDDEEILIVEF